MSAPHAAVLAELHDVLRARAVDPPPGSYSATLLADPVLASRKVMEEAYEVCLEAVGPARESGAGGASPRLASEAADLVFHLMAPLVGAGVAWDDVLAELAARRT